MKYLFALIAFLILLWGGIMLHAIDEGAHEVASFKSQCAADGGHIYGTGLYLCLTPDQRIVEVYP